MTKHRRAKLKELHELPTISQYMNRIRWRMRGTYREGITVGVPAITEDVPLVATAYLTLSYGS